MTLSPERRLMIGVLRSFLGTADGPPSVPDNVDWDGFLAMLRFHRLLPVADSVLSKGDGRDAPPPFFAGALRQGARESFATALFLEAHLRTLAEAFRRRGIPFVVLKGAALAAEYYDPPHLRPYGDLDILIRYGDFSRTRDLLSGEGFLPEDAGRDRFTRESVKAVPWKHPLQPGLSVDLQWETVTLYWGKTPFLSGDGAWKRVHEIRHQGMSFPGLDPTLLVPYLCVHLMSHHHFSPLINVADIGLVLRNRRFPVDWEGVMRIAAEQGIRRALYHPLRFLRDLLGVAVPEAVLEELKPGFAARGFFPSRTLAFRSGPLPRWAERTVKFFLIDGWRERGKALETFYRYRVAGRTGPRP
jgi:hypothetical protein